MRCLQPMKLLQPGHTMSIYQAQQGFEVSRAGFFRANWLIPILASDEYYRQSLHSAADDSTTALEDEHEKN